MEKYHATDSATIKAASITDAETMQILYGRVVSWERIGVHTKTGGGKHVFGFNCLFCSTLK